MTHLYVIGGQQRVPRPMIANEREWYEYERGLVLKLDTETGHAAIHLSYVSRPDACASTNPEILFKSATLQNGILYACTQTEVVLFSVPDFQEVGYVSLPCFNDVHHVYPTPAGSILVANSGLDMVLELTKSGEVLRTWDVLGEPLWSRFSPTADYRKGASTKPHRSHPNYVFMLDDDVWTTRFQQKDVICLTNPGRRIEIGLERVHDGVLHEGRLYFTTVNGRIMIVDSSSLTVDDVVDLTAMHDASTLLGWCRSIFIDGSRAWIGFSRIRPTKFRENVGWVLHGFKNVLPTHLACYDLVERRCLAEIEVEQFGLNAIFGIFPAAPSS